MIVRRLLIVASPHNVSLASTRIISLAPSLERETNTHTTSSENTQTISIEKFTYYGVATTSRLLKVIGLFCKRAL